MPIPLQHLCNQQKCAASKHDKGLSMLKYFITLKRLEVSIVRAESGQQKMVS